MTKFHASVILNVGATLWLLLLCNSVDDVKAASFGEAMSQAENLVVEAVAKEVNNFENGGTPVAAPIDPAAILSNPQGSLGLPMKESPVSNPTGTVKVSEAEKAAKPVTTTAGVAAPGVRETASTPTVSDFTKLPPVSSALGPAAGAITTMSPPDNNIMNEVIVDALGAAISPNTTPTVANKQTPAPISPQAAITPGAAVLAETETAIKAPASEIAGQPLAVKPAIINDDSAQAKPDKITPPKKAGRTHASPRHANSTTARNSHVANTHTHHDKATLNETAHVHGHGHSKATPIAATGHTKPGKHTPHGSVAVI